MNHFNKFIFYLYFGLLIFACLSPSKAINSLQDRDIFHFRMDYILHCVAFFIWIILMKNAFKLSFREKIKMTSLLLIVAVVVAAFLELIQLWIPARTFNPVDMACNAGGVSLAGFLIYIRKI